jgi:hypothetical protein
MFPLVDVATSADGCDRDRHGRPPATDENVEDVVNVMQYSGYTLYQAERVKTEAERRQADIAQGMIAAELSRLCRDLTQPFAALRRSRARRHPAHAVRKTGLATVEHHG